MVIEPEAAPTIPPAMNSRIPAMKNRRRPYTSDSRP
jgi:hypothetical protein